MGLTAGGLYNYRSRTSEILEIDKYLSSDTDTYRVTLVSGDFNLFMNTEHMCKDCFISVVSGNTDDIYESLLGCSRDVVSILTVETKYFDAITSVKYAVIDKEFVDNFEDYVIEGKGYNVEFIKQCYKTYGYRLLPNYEVIKDYGQFVLCKNKEYMPFGIGYRSYITQSNFNNLDIEKKNVCAKSSVIIKDEEVEKFNDLGLRPYADSPDTVDIEQIDVSFNRNSIKETVSCENDCLLMISVPYEYRGWTATVNGVPSEIIVVDGGFMAVKLEKGINEVCFNYKTPYLSKGLIVSGVSFVSLLLYILCGYIISKKKRVG